MSMKFTVKDKDPGCLLVVAAIVVAGLMGCLLEVCQTAIKDIIKTEHPTDTIKQVKQQTNNQIENIFWNQKIIRSK